MDDTAILVEGNIFFIFSKNPHNRSGVHPAAYSMCTDVICRG